MKRLGLALLSLACMAGCEGSRAPSQAPITAENSAKPDSMPNNTGVNARDRDQAARTPLDQGESKSDVAITADIRKSVVDAKMSTDAKNVKIITENGHVVLRGPVDSENEKTRIGEIAQKAAGEGNVDNQLEVAGQK